MLELQVTNDGKPVTLKFEHSLLSVSKWEAKHKKAFLGSAQKTPEELIEYYEYMLVYPTNKSLVYLLEPEQLKELTDYINDSRTASSVPEIATKQTPKETVTSELIYYWMVGLEIPFEAEKWHLSRLLMLIRITNFKNSPPEKQNKATMIERMRALNEERKKQFNTKG